MPFEKVDTQVDFPAQERAILEFWKQTGVFDRLREKNRGKPKWSFLDGPITANNPMGVHHAWGRTYKDVYQRFFAMTGHELRYQNGFDCQGLWVEVEVEKELGLKSKRDIENLVPGDRFASIDKFVQLCKQRVDRFANVQTEQSIRLGYWMDWDQGADWQKRPDERRSYFTMSEENNYTIWSFLKKCHGRGLVYRGFDAMPWCPRCGVGLSEMEVKEGYKQVAHKSVFVKFPLRAKPPAGEPSRVSGRVVEEKENLLVWTTTPWTLTSNVGAAVNPELAYLKVRHKGEIYYVGKTAFTASRSEEEAVEDEVEVEVERPQGKKAAPPRLKTIEQLFKEKGKEGFEIVGEVTGADMVGWTYDGPFDELPAQANAAGYPHALAEVVRNQNWAPNTAANDAHRVVAWKEVGATTGTGIVHIAPGCGKEDFLLGKEQGLPPVAPLDDAGTFLSGFGWLEGLSAVEPTTADRILDDLKQKGRLFASELYPHSYPHCWRCKTELLFRLVDEWFIDMKWREEIMDVTRQVTFLPESINGRARELKWLEQMGDWMISKKRFWGLALPIWVDEHTGDFEVIGSREELKARAVEGWTDFDGHTPHRPWVDKIKIRNPKTGNLMSRIPDVGNPWLDAGIVPYSTMGYNHDRSTWDKWFPADFITESFPGQFRNWFYAILAMSTMMENRPPFKVLLGHALVRDEHGATMSKSLSNAIEFNEAADRMGADVMRWLYCRSNPANNINFGYGPAEELRAKFVLKLWNTYAFFVNYARLDGFDPNAPQVPVKDRPDIDRWILSDLQLLIQTARREFERFNVQAFCVETEKFVDDKLSNWYVRRNRRRFWKSEQGADKQAAYQTLYAVLVTLTKLGAPVMPFLAEKMFQNLCPNPTSIHLSDFPQFDESLIDADLSADMNHLLAMVTLGLASRNKAKIKVRQPLAEVRICGDGDDERVVERFRSELAEELNVKNIRFHALSDGPLLAHKIVPRIQALAPKHKSKLNEVVATIAKLDPAAVKERRLNKDAVDRMILLECPSGNEWLLPAEYELIAIAPDGWEGDEDFGIQCAVDIRITQELKYEGMARDVVRHIQNLRKDAGLEMDDRIELYIGTEPESLRQAIGNHNEYIANETLTASWSGRPMEGEGVFTANVKVEGHSLLIQLRKVADHG